MVTIAFAGLFLVYLSPERLKMRYFFLPPACGGRSPRHEGYITNLLPGHKITLHIYPEIDKNL